MSNRAMQTKLSDAEISTLFASIEYEASSLDLYTSLKTNTKSFFNSALKHNKGRYPDGSKMTLRQDLVAYDLISELGDEQIKALCQEIWQLCLFMPKSAKEEKRINDRLGEIGKELNEIGEDILLNLVFRFSPIASKHKLFDLWGLERSY